MAAQFSVLANISRYIDSLLQPFVVKCDTFLKDTADFIQKVEGIQIHNDAVIVTFVVISLYTSIPLDEARATIQYYLSDATYDGPPCHFILQLVDILLEKNYFKYQDQFFLQIKAVSMGSPFVPSLANLFMAQLENDFILNAQVNPFHHQIFKFYRFIDDCFCILTDASVLTEFLE